MVTVPETKSSTDASPEKVIMELVKDVGEDTVMSALSLSHRAEYGPTPPVIVRLTVPTFPEEALRSSEKLVGSAEIEKGVVEAEMTGKKIIR
jgi:hypothetical protein